MILLTNKQKLEKSGENIVVFALHGLSPLIERVLLCHVKAPTVPNEGCLSLSELCDSASCGEVFLLASAALANITFFDSMACEILLQLNAIHILLQACRDRQRVDTPYSKDQVQHQIRSDLCTLPSPCWEMVWLKLHENTSLHMSSS